MDTERCSRRRSNQAAMFQVSGLSLQVTHLSVISHAEMKKDKVRSPLSCSLFSRMRRSVMVAAEVRCVCDEECLTRDWESANMTVELCQPSKRRGGGGRGEETRKR